MTAKNVMIMRMSVAAITHGLWLTEESGTRGAIRSEARSDSDMVVTKQDVDETVEETAVMCWKHEGLD